MLYSNSDIGDLVRLTNIELEKLRVWFALNRLSLNISKTNYMFFGHHHHAVSRYATKTAFIS